LTPDTFTRLEFASDSMQRIDRFQYRQTDWMDAIWTMVDIRATYYKDLTTNISQTSKKLSRAVQRNWSGLAVDYGKSQRTYWNSRADTASCWTRRIRVGKIS